MDSFEFAHLSFCHYVHIIMEKVADCSLLKRPVVFLSQQKRLSKMRLSKGDIDELTARLKNPRKEE